MNKICLLLLLSAFSLSLFADVKLPRIFGDNMVMQRDQKIQVWGWASPKEKITILLNKQVKKVTADRNGKWRIALDAESAGGPYQFTVKGKNSLTYNNVMIGDVWLCSGQSNMEWTVRNSNQAQQEINAAKYPMIRHFKVPNTVASSPREDINGGDWKVCSPATVADFTAVGYFFARELVKELNVPVGLLNTSWGGTHVETWTSREAFENNEEFTSMISGLPKLDFDSLAKESQAKTLKRIEGLQGSLQSAKADISSSRDITYNDNGWPQLKAPGLWEQQSPGDLDGVVWLRKTIDLPSDQAGREAVLELAMIDDADETYINGTKVGSTTGYNSKRKYNIPSGLLKEGKNVILIKVLDTGGGGGIHGDAADLKLTVGNKSIPLAGDWRFKVESLGGSSSGVGPNSYPTLLFNGMVNPLIPYTIKGALWYQGESNAGRSFQYRKAFPLMITDWRQRWNQGDFPFYFVQLASFNANNGNTKTGSGWAELREAQALTLGLPNTGMAVTTDIGDPKDIHPRNKQDVGKRLALIALNKTYGKDVQFSGPVYQSMQVEGNRAILTFTNTGGGLMAKDKYGYLRGFEIAGKDQQFHFARAFIEGNKVIVFHDDVKAPVAVRFGWADDAGDNNLFNKEGLPAGPFRTDSWKGITEANKFQVGR